MSIASEITRLQTDSAAIASAISAKGVTVPSGSGYDDYATLISSIPSGGGGGGGGILPSGYTHHDYIYGNGNAFIATDVTGSALVEMTVQADSSQLNKMYFGCSTTWLNYFTITNTNGYIGFSNDSGYYVTSPSNTSKVHLSVFLIARTYMASVNGSVIYKTRSSDKTYTGKWCFMNVNETGTQVMAGKLWEARIYKSGVLSFNGIPCTRNSDNKAGLYDTVSGSFYASSGTSDFTAGDD